MNDEVKTIVEKWSSYTNDIKCDQEKKILSTIFENCEKLINYNFKQLLNLEQLISLNKEIFVKLKYKKMVSIQPLLDKEGIIYFLEKFIPVNSQINNINLIVKSKKLLTRTIDYGINHIVDIQNDSTYIANIIDTILLTNLNVRSTNFINFFELYGCDTHKIADYIIAPTKFKEIIDTNQIDFYENNQYKDLVFIGKYSTSFMQQPIFAPYLLAYSKNDKILGDFEFFKN